jgi:hypothetical protein
LLQELAEELAEMPFDELRQFKKTEGVVDFKQRIKASCPKSDRQSQHLTISIIGRLRAPKATDEKTAKS